MQLRNPILFYVFVVFLVVNLVDAITSLFILDAEAHPLYLFGGTIWWVLVLKFAVVFAIGFIVIRNKYDSNFNYYTFVLILIMGTLLVGIGVYSNIWGMTHPEELKEASGLSVEEKIKGYSTMVTVIYFLPMAFSLTAFKVYDMTHFRVIIKKKKKDGGIDGN